MPQIGGSGVMDEFLIVLFVFILLIAAGVTISVRFYTHGAIGRWRRIRKIRAERGGPVVEEIIEEEEPPVEEEEEA
jgi:hypothetical protein